MSHAWEVFDSGSGDAASIMARDEGLFRDLRNRPRPLLHFYAWAHARPVTHGCFTQPSQWLRTVEGLDLAKRPTGGGVTLHFGDLAFSALVPAHYPHYCENDHLENYRYINQLVMRALRQVFPGHYTCLEKPEIPTAHACCMMRGTQYDVMCGSQKAAGAAQRTRRGVGYLHQGTISLWYPGGYLIPYFTDEERGIMRELTFSPLAHPRELNEGRHSIKEALMRAVQEEDV